MRNFKERKSCAKYICIYYVYTVITSGVIPSGVVIEKGPPNAILT